MICTRSLAATLLAVGLASATQSPWDDSALPIPTRVRHLMDAMTLTERARQTYAFHNLPEFVSPLKEQLSSTSFGSLKLSGIKTDLAGVQVATRNQLQARPRAKPASRSFRRALLTPQVNTGSLYRCGKRT